MSQMVVLLYLGRQKTVSAAKLSELSGIPLDQLTVVLNSLIMVKLICREEGDAGDTSKLFALNDGFYFPQTRVSLVRMIEKAYNKQNQPSYLVGFSRMIQLRIVKEAKMNAEKKFTAEELKIVGKKNIHPVPTDDILDSTLEYLVEEDYLTTTDVDGVTHYSYMEEEDDSDSDSDSDSD